MARIVVTLTMAAVSAACPGRRSDADLDGLLLAPRGTAVWNGVVALWSGRPVSRWYVDNQAVAHAPWLPGFIHVLDTRGHADGMHSVVAEIDRAAGHTAERIESRVAFHTSPRDPGVTHFTDVSEAAGLPASDVVSTRYRSSPHGAAAADIDGDGRDDLIVWSNDGVEIFGQDHAMHFASTGFVSRATTISAGLGDLDGDGDPDLVTTGPTTHVFRNDAGLFVDVTGIALPSALMPPRSARGVTFADIDMDGLLDIAIGDQGCQAPTRSFVLHNEGELHFADITDSFVPETSNTSVFGFAIDRYDLTRAFHVQTLTEGCLPDGPEAWQWSMPPGQPHRTEPTLDGPFAFTPMGSAWLDANEDGAIDLYMPGSVTNVVFTGETLTDDIAPSVGLAVHLGTAAAPVDGWSPALIDADLDGHADLFVTFDGYADAGDDERASGLSLYRRVEHAGFADIAVAAGFDPGVTHCEAVFADDLDADGDSDLLVGCLDGVRLFRNDRDAPDLGRTLVLRGHASNTDGVHSIVRTSRGEERLVRGGGQPYAGGVVRETLRVDSDGIDVEWPTGYLQHVLRGNVPRLVIDEPLSLSVTPRRIEAGASRTVNVTINAPTARHVTVRPTGSARRVALTHDTESSWHGVFQLPDAVSEQVTLSVEIDGFELGIRPTIYLR